MAENGAVAPSGGEEAPASCPCSSGGKLLDDKLHPIEEQLQYLLSKADEFQNLLVYKYSEKNAFTDILKTFASKFLMNPHTCVMSHIPQDLVKLSLLICMK